jgi:phosphotransferase system IIB component
MNAPFSADNFYDEFLNNSPVLKLSEIGRQQAEHEAEEEQQFLTALGVDCEEEEEQQFQAALIASRSLMSSSSSPPPPNPLTQSHGATSFSTPSSSTPSSSASSPLLDMSLPSTITQINDTSRRPTITTQMNPTWMREYEDRTKAKSGKKGLLRIDPAVVRKFNLVFWDDDNRDAAIICIHDCPQWPIFILHSSPDILKRLGEDITDIDLYHLKHRVWVQIDLTYPHSISTDAYIFLRRRGVQCVDLDNLIERFSKPAARIRLDMHLERQMARNKLKKNKKGKVVAEESDSDIEFVMGQSAIKRRRIKQELNLEYPPLWCKEVALPLTGPGSSASFPISIPNTPTSYLPPCHPSSRSSSPVVHPVPTRPWPAGMFMVDMVHGFRRMDNLIGMTVQERFEDVFGEPYVRSTYADQRRRWLLASEKQREVALAGNRTVTGLWSMFARGVPLR